MSLEAWLKNGWLKTHKTSRQEIANLLAVADRDLKQCRLPKLIPDWRLNIAYNAALQLATAALAASGYEAERSNKHMRVIQSLEFTIDLEPALVDQLDKFRTKRHIAGYEQVGAISDHEASEMQELGEKLRRRVKAWLGKEHSYLLEA